MISFIKKETVLCISLALALLSMLLTPPNAGYLAYVDFSVIGILFCLMVTVQGFGKTGLFDFVSKQLTRRFKNTRSLSAALVGLCFFMSMFITNDVALLSFVPLTLLLFSGKEKVRMRCVILETAAANLGSMATPIGNPQNLYIYTHYDYTLSRFFSVMLPISGMSLALIMLSLILIPGEKITPVESGAKFTLSRNFFVYAAVFALCLCTVAKLVDYRICLALTLLAAVIFDVKILAKPDYALLATFVCFFVFVGNISAVPEVRGIISDIILDRETLISCALSQIISNVPCALMVSGFTDKADAVLLGVNIGGMGTLIASLASLISYKLYSRSDGARKGRYLAEFTVYNFAVLALLAGFVFVAGNL